MLNIVASNLVFEDCIFC